MIAIGSARTLTIARRVTQVLGESDIRSGVHAIERPSDDRVGSVALGYRSVTRRWKASATRNEAGAMKEALASAMERWAELQREVTSLRRTLGDRKAKR